MKKELLQYKKQWENLRLDNDFLFGKVMQDPKLCRELLQRILPDMKITRIIFPEGQKMIRPDVDAKKSVRLDIYVEDDKKVIYDVEIQKVDTKELPKRSRYYQSMIDVQLLERGHNYNELRKSFIIFICLKDIFGQGRHIYTFKNICEQNNALPLRDEAVKIFLNAEGVLDNVSPELKLFLDYLKGKTAGTQTEDPYIQELEVAVRKAKRNREWRREYMMLWMRDQENIERGIEQGLKQGIEQGIKQGMRRGRKQGRQEGMKQQRRDIILRMIDQGLSDKQIKSLCNSSNKEISECRASVQKELNTMTD